MGNEVAYKEVVQRHCIADVYLDPHAPLAHRVILECGCHNPDETGAGREDFRAESVDDAADQWFDHLLDELGKVGASR